MDRLARMADFARKQKGKGIVLRGNDTCLLLSERGTRQPLNKVMSTEELDALLREVLPAELTGRLDAGEPFTFTHATPDGDLTVRVARPGGTLDVTIGLSDDAHPEAAAPAPSPQPSASTTTVSVAVPVDLAPASTVSPPLEVQPPPDLAAVVDHAFEPRPVVEFPLDYLPGLFRAALAALASDVYLEGGSRPWARVAGEVQPLEFGRPLSPEQIQTSLFDLMPTAIRPRWIAEATAEFCLTFEDRARIRCSIFNGLHGTCASFRLLPLNPSALADLQAPAFVGDLARVERGLVLLGGVRGAGTTTTLAAMVDAINTARRARVVTLEAPIEILHGSGRCLVTQIEIPTHAPTPLDGLRRLSLADVDVCAIGDATDPALLSAALRLAEGGVLVLAVVRQPDVPAVVEHLLDCAAAGSRQPGERVLRVLRGVVCQRLCRPHHPGRMVPLFEMLNVGSAAAALIRQGKPRELHGTMFMTFDNALAGCVKDEKITRDEALRQATDADTLRRLMGPGA